MERTGMGTWKEWERGQEKDGNRERNGTGRGK